MHPSLLETRRLLAETERQCQDIAWQAMQTRYLLSEVQKSSQALSLLYQSAYQSLAPGTGLDSSQKAEATLLLLE